MNWSVVFDNLALFLWGDGIRTTGLLLTVELFITSLGLGLAMAIPLSLLRVSNNPLLRTPVWLFTYVFRGTPLLVQIYIIYFGLAEIGWIRSSWAWHFLREAYICAWLAISLNTAAYTIEILAGCIRKTFHGEIEAARAMGMGRWTQMRHIILPGAMRRAIPAYSNEVILTLHATALASSITLLDLAGVGRSISMRYASPYEAYIAALVLYAVFTTLVFLLFRLAEGKWLAYLRPSSTHP
ncbi:amino acid ABC transporter permease [Pseudomonas gingeri NCPPB 3146 = LMG 5327]|uniref:Arginine ABC transporter permease protein ArtM n=2 Tax=Pseudomonas gingeri TaxID=117681 RepID=A0A7Y7XX56_9PSED|nr:ABC transporter permease subunit [Pseudomonas gingeri]NWA08765.1 ABC transporter permease subunit [Pseudomonas gingeri]NWC12727.1 ABC transporter permease subunit [Pseudomonas gingeri]NWE49490.1 ABC transporter permease subunit [Pseudomonas gingeri]NWE70352.1 ABC transporter permease subunit [Pseudomonas gingeri]PNQ93005.1 amino acid ABC transporter permease [Pseudomonas gingeri NCPPB 3146 = LMG 5327]